DDVNNGNRHVSPSAERTRIPERGDVHEPGGGKRRAPERLALSPYTTLFRSQVREPRDAAADDQQRDGEHRRGPAQQRDGERADEIGRAHGGSAETREVRVERGAGDGGRRHAGLGRGDGDGDGGGGGRRGAEH